MIHPETSSADNSVIVFKKERNRHDDDSIDIKDEHFGIGEHILIGLSYLAFIFTFPLSIILSLKIIQEYERGVVFRLGKVRNRKAKGPGMIFVLPCVDTVVIADLRSQTFDVPPQEIITKDSVTVTVDAVVYIKIFDPTLSVVKVENAQYSTRVLASTTLRNILGTKTLHEILMDRTSTAMLLEEMIEETTNKWGVRVERVEIKDVSLPVSMQRVMASEAEATREAKAKVIASEGEQKASYALKEAADMIERSPTALQLRYLQTLSNISTDKCSTIIFPVPIDFLSSFSSMNNDRKYQHQFSEKENLITDSDNFIDEFDQNEMSMNENLGSNKPMQKSVKDPNRAYSLRKSASSKNQNVVTSKR